AAGIRIEQLERENTELRSLIERLMAETEVQRFTYRKQLEVISQLQNENECLREQREILMAPMASYHTRQRIGDFLSGDLDTIVEDETLDIINYRIMFIEMRTFKRNREKQKSSVKRYHV
ncbi:uncharacterized protein LOC135702049, partial [Ochlerotatus camptorhynchus]|uniref:uncharacterized protein LOC135702049 n=1 Tax=Ochlerotatus camptorhynchus TaxID=644619 RepID=UPI0031DA2237